MRYLTHDLPGTGGSYKTTPADFQVEEIPAYLPSGAGEHTFLFIEKQGLTTQHAVAALCQALNTHPAEAGTAGLKDRHALTRQWISLPRVDPEAAARCALTPPQGGSVRVLSAARHGNKLRTGHLRGNRFVLVVRDVPPEGLGRAQAVLARLLQHGVPNRYGDQRFGSGDRNVEQGVQLLRGALRLRDRFRRRFLISAVQSALFNRYYDDRHADDLLRAALLGDVLQKTDTGGVFTVGAADLADAQQRLDQGLLGVTGPMFGGRMIAPPAGTPAAAREDAVLLSQGLARELFTGPLADGTRRPLLIRLQQDPDAPLVAAHPDDPAALVLRFTLPPGAYATVVLDEVMKPAADPAEDPEKDPAKARPDSSPAEEDGEPDHQPEGLSGIGDA